ncbi:hypothetical protein CF326_g4004 [Tilletia indica]|nr:hypothetical protein CF326_g4004 [Tilletia indica]
MSLLLAPYNNGMRLGQGFNSYTQQICVDDAVVMNPERAENVVTNDGVTMRILAQKMKKASVWRQMAEYVVNGELADGDTEPDPNQRPPSGEDSATETADPEYEEDNDEDVTERSKLVKEEEERQARLALLKSQAPASNPDGTIANAEQPSQTTNGDTKPGDMTNEQVTEELEKEKQHAAETNKKLTVSREASIKADAQKMMSKVENAKEELDKKTQAFNEKVAARSTGMGKSKRLTWSMEKSIGTSQIVSYSSRFIDKLSEVADDMSASAALAIKTGSFGGSGSGAFIDTDKFHSSDIKLYLSCKVINQSVNFKDSLEYNPIRSVSEANQELFTKVFGDSFISGFLEGGELNAVVLIKILNDVKRKDIMAEAQVALTKGLEIDGQGNIALAKANIAMNTEVSINVRWSGGGSIKSYNEEWTIDSLMAAANRFPYLVSQFPQRTYAILTKYESLRSFVSLKPKKLSPIKYENAAIYTNMLMDSYLEYKTLFKQLANDIRAVQSGEKRFKAEVPTTEVDGKKQVPVLSKSLTDAKLVRFEASLEGLDLARREIRNQMNNIVREVDGITKNPAIATMDRGNIYVGPASLRTLIPAVEYKVRRIRSKPMSEKRINNEVDATNAEFSKSDNLETHLFEPSQTPLPLSEMEQIKVADLERQNPDLAETTRITPPVGSLTTGSMFCTIDFGLQEPIITEISVGQQAGVLRALSVTYSNGLSVELGDSIDLYTLHEGNDDAITEEAKVLYTLSELSSSESITSASIQVDAVGDEKTLSVVGLIFNTNKGRTLSALCKVSAVEGHSKLHRFEKPITDAYVSGFWGRARSPQDASGANEDGGRITRLGLIWTQAVVKETIFDEDQPIECLASGIEPLRTDAKLRVCKFGRRFPGIPQLILGYKGLILETPSACLTTGTPDVGADQFTYSIMAEDCIATSSWMVLPELEDVHMQCGEVKIDIDDSEKSETVRFDLPFKEGTSPQVVCWLVEFFTGNSSCDISVGVVDADRVKPTHVELKVTDSQGRFDSSASEKRPLTCGSITIGWLAHDKTSIQRDASFLSGNFDLALANTGEQIAPIQYKPPFANKPMKHFLALSAIKANLRGTSKEERTFYVQSKNITSEKLELGLEGPPNSVCKGVWISSI